MIRSGARSSHRLEIKQRGGTQGERSERWGVPRAITKPTEEKVVLAVATVLQANHRLTDALTDPGTRFSPSMTGNHATFVAVPRFQ
jgi:hypothetical protein